jgi:hypothetical protein
MQPEPRDPWESMHQAAIKSLGLIGDELKQQSVAKEATHHEQTGKRRQKITRHKERMHGISSHKLG